MMAFFETIVPTCTMTQFFQVTTLLIGFLVYSEACLSDIRSMLDQIDRLSNSEMAESRLVARFNEIINLHGRLHKYFLNCTTAVAT